MLSDALDEIMEAIREKIEAAVGDPQSRLSHVNSVVRGDRRRTQPELPSVWIFAEVARAEHSPTTLAEIWTLPIVLVAVVKNDEPEQGYIEATRLAADVRSVVIEDRTLGKRSIVQDTRSSRFEPSGPWHREGSQFGAVAVVEVTFKILEG